MPYNIDNLQIKVDADAKAADSALQKLIGDLRTLKNVTSGGVSGLGRVSEDLKNLSNAASVVNGAGIRTAASSLKAMAEGVNALSSVSGRGIKSTSDNLQTLVTPVSLLAGSSGNNFRLNAEHIAGGITALASAGKVGSMKSTINQLTGLAAPVEGLAGVNAGAFSANAQGLVSGLNALASVGKINLRGSINQLRDLPGVITALEQAPTGAFAAKLYDLAPALNSLSEVGRVNLRGLYNQLMMLPEVSAALNKVDMTKFSRQVSQAADALKKLPTSASGAKAALIRIPSGAKPAGAALNEVARNTQNLSYRFGVMAKMARRITTTMVLVRAMTRLSRALAGALTKSNEFIETLNLFNVEMGEYAESARRYAEKVNELIGIDVAEWMNNQGNFMQLVSGFDVASDKAALMSQNLTQLGYDLASFFNASDINQPFERLRSAMAGEIKGMRQYGADMTVASMQAYMLKQGIDAQWNSLDQASKAMLRYNFMIEKFTNVEGDMARTLDSPANALRILNTQFEQLKRSIGNIVSVFATKLIPVVQTAVIWMRHLADTVASLLGFTIDWNTGAGGGSGKFADSFSGTDRAAKNMDSLASGTSKVAKNATKAAKAAKDLKRQLMGFDEINRLSDMTDPDTGGGSSSGGGGGGIGSGIGSGLGGLTHLDLEPLDYTERFLEGLEGVVFDLGNAFDWLRAKTGWDWTPLQNSLTRIKNAFVDIAGTVSGALKWAWDNVLVPLGRWTIEHGAPAALELFGSALELVSAVLKALKPYAEWAWNNFLQPIASWTGGMIVTILNDITHGIEWLTDKVKNTEAFSSFMNVVTAVGRAIASLEIAGVITPVIKTLGSVFLGVKPFITGVIDALAGGEGIFSMIKGAITGVVGEGTYLGTLFQNLVGFIDPVTVVVGLVVAAFLDLMATSKDFRTKVFGAVQGVWEGIKEAFAGIVSAVGTVVSSVGELASAFCNFYVESGLQTLVGGVLGLLVDMLGGALKNSLKAVGIAFRTAGGLIGAVVSVVTNVLNAFTSLASWFRQGGVDNVISNIRKAFKGSSIREIGVNILKGIGKGLVAGVKGIWNFVKNVFSGVVKAFKKAFGISSPAKKMKAIGKAIWDGVLAGITGALKGIGQWIKNKILAPFVNKLKSQIHNYKKFKEEGGNIITFILNGIVDGLKNIGSWVKTNILDKIVKGLTDKIPGASDLLDSGKDIIGKVLEGITSGLSSIGSWVSEHILTPIKDAISGGKKDVSNAIGDLTGDNKDVSVNASVNLSKSGWTTVKGWVENVTNFGEGLKEKAVSLGKSGWTTVKSWTENATNFGADLKEKAVSLGKSGWTTVKGWTESATNFGSDLKEKVVSLGKLGWTTVKTWVESTNKGNWGDDLKGKDVSLSKSGWTTVKTWVESTNKGNWGDDLKGKAVSLGKSGWSTVKGWVESTKNGNWGDDLKGKGIKLAKSGWSTVSAWVKKSKKGSDNWGDAVSKGIGLKKSGWSTVTAWVKKSKKGSDNWGDSVNKGIGLTKRGWSTVSAWVKKSGRKVNNWGDDINKSVGLAKSGWSTVWGWVKKHWGQGQSVKLKLSWFKGGKGTPAGMVADINRALSGIKSVSLVNSTEMNRVDRFALGGFPTDGELFIAREPGNPELVGNVGGRTAVMNNKAIVEAVSRGVAQAVESAMRPMITRQNQSGQPVRVSVQIDGREVGKAAVNYHNNVVRASGYSPLLV